MPTPTRTPIWRRRPGADQQQAQHRDTGDDAGQDEERIERAGRGGGGLRRGICDA
ncbi:hypothetical protein ABT063_30095 [Streptomyces sp. NPDC002838]|uniref:hypothetical protein n=1 Tax=Streptomyces sp. NPDC002838 TaxID=3154436 RepID=UPI00331A8D48